MKFFDLHCDTPYELYKRKLPFNCNNLAVNGQKAKYLEDWHQCFAVWIKDDLENPFDFYKEVINSFKSKLSNCPENLTPYFAVEGGRVIENELDRLEVLKKDKIRYITLTWNGKNSIASGGLAEGGLTDFGVQVIKGMNQMGIACDLSHINSQGFFEALEYADFPLVTHACLNSVHNHKRNLSDLQVREVCNKKGIIGICFYPEFSGEGNILENIYKNIYNVLNMGFENNIAIGSDFDGGEMSPRLLDITFLPKLYCFLRQKGIGDRELEKIFYSNAINFFNRL